MKNALNRKLLQVILAAAVAMTGLALAPGAPARAVTPVASSPSEVAIRYIPPEEWPTTKEWRRGVRVGTAAEGRVTRVTAPPESKPRLRKRYVRRAARSLNAAHSEVTLGSVTVARFGWWGCAVSVARFLAENGLPIAKTFRVAKEARALYGSVWEIIRAIKDGRAWTAFGDEGTETLKILIGSAGLFESCF